MAQPQSNNPFSDQYQVPNYGPATADILHQYCPLLAEQLRARGVPANTADLNHLIGNPEIAYNLANGLSSVFHTIEASLRSLLNERDSAATNAAHQAALYNASQHDVSGYQAQIVQLQADVNAKTDLVTGLTNQLAAASFHRPADTANADSVNPRGRIADDPGIFEPLATDTDEERQNKFITWKSRVMVALVQDRHIYNTPERIILYVIMRMGTSVYETWADAIGKMVKDGMPTASTEWEWKSPKDLWEDLNKQYVVVNIKLQSNLAFRVIHQDEPTTYNMTTPDFSTFLSYFMKLATRSGKTPEQKVEALKQKVSKYIASRFAGVVEPPKDVDWDGWLKLARRFEQSRIEFAQNEDFQKKSNSGTKQQHNHSSAKPISLPSPTPPANGDPMELDRLFLGRLNDVQRDICIKLGLCFFCRKAGHAIGDCAAKQAADQSNANKTQQPMYRPVNMRPITNPFAQGYSGSANQSRGPAQQGFGGQQRGGSPARGMGGQQRRGNGGGGGQQQVSFGELRAMEERVRHDGGFVDDAPTSASDNDTSQYQCDNQSHHSFQPQAQDSFAPQQNGVFMDGHGNYFMQQESGNG